MTWRDKQLNQLVTFYSGGTMWRTLILQILSFEMICDTSDIFRYLEFWNDLLHIDAQIAPNQSLFPAPFDPVPINRTEGRYAGAGFPWSANFRDLKIAPNCSWVIKDQDLLIFFQQLLGHQQRNRPQIRSKWSKPVPSLPVRHLFWQLAMTSPSAAPWRSH